MKFRFLPIAGCLLGACLFAGCGGGGGSTVTGKVTFADGKSATDGNVVFNENEGSYQAFGAPIGSDGKYSISIAPGKYTITLESGTKSVFADTYRSGDTSGYAYTVTEAGGTFDIKGVQKGSAPAVDEGTPPTDDSGT